MTDKQNEINVENVMKAAEILENKYEMLYEDIVEDEVATRSSESAER